MHLKTTFAAGLALLLSCSSLQATEINTADSSEVTALKQAFISDQVNKGFSEQEVKDFLATANHNQAVLDAISKPWEAKPWHQYYPIFLTDKRLEKGLEFWHDNAETINNAADKFQVDPQIIVAIIGIETFYGGYMGNYKVQDALYTLGFYYPPRATFFRSEFGNLMSLVKEEQLDNDNLKGSYAGAMGFGQFIPSSYRHYAVDFSGDGRRDLLNNKQDAIGSVANYFHQHGWQRGAPVTLELNHTVDTAPKAKVWVKGKPTQTVADILTPTLSLAKAKDIDASQRALLVKLDQPEATEYWLGLNNFYVITRYNRSPLYAMAVYQFSQQLEAAYHAN
ncbi:lytic murein transglycosylase B [Shewanella sp. 1_MG-2023]|uniref:lytic murein transglycosylase B n=1 Tax=unclassified Shewanella TaxID=196818 RepID=UPI0026E42BEF|nr:MULTISPECIES: lytic murein transglycosylase B [unclassified Shewanella]MDO6613813.1 lytic murein transglycosylase B [Shewanella sp. 7_MG-2023]MDO6773563.1 lytic murein transglycosylase B [Shewanella sp. 2_MG-2023]MDO6796420.1 lytic murein transglycosylase B [Shewanella sp. 1_MG-2023]